MIFLKKENCRSYVAPSWEEDVSVLPSVLASFSRWVTGWWLTCEVIQLDLGNIWEGNAKLLVCFFGIPVFQKLKFYRLHTTSSDEYNPKILYISFKWVAFQAHTGSSLEHNLCYCWLWLNFSPPLSALCFWGEYFLAAVMLMGYDIKEGQIH